jgi:outer membrane protein OmpA-like peptidoglycan-associated protein
MKQKNDYFWPSYTDLMTSLFFIMLVLYVLTYVVLNNTIRLQKEKLAIIETVQQNLKPLKNDTTLFKYEDAYKRFKLAFDVKYNKDKYSISNDDLLNFSFTVNKIKQAGMRLKSVIDTLNILKTTNYKLRNVSYIVSIAGYASRTGTEEHNYILSYQRALALWSYWKKIGIDFEQKGYEQLIDLQIAGNGWGGIGRLSGSKEEDNQRFLIQIFPKIGDIR